MFPSIVLRHVTPVTLLVAYPDDRMLSDLGLTPGQSFMLRAFAERVIDELVSGEEAAL
jgi:hypothetical protein